MIVVYYLKMDLPHNHELNTFLGRVFEEWRIFDMLEEVPKIEKNILPWIYALWSQVGGLLLFLTISLVILKKESMKLNSEALAERNATGKKNQFGKRIEVTDEVGFNAELHDAARKFYVEKDSVNQFVLMPEMEV